jgi:hypothetical protein
MDVKTTRLLVVKFLIDPTRYYNIWSAANKYDEQGRKYGEHTATYVLGQHLFTDSLQSVDQACDSRVILGFGPRWTHDHKISHISESTTDSLQIHSTSINTETGANTDII